MEILQELLAAKVPGNSFASWAIFTIALFLYFFAEYKTKSVSDPFSLGFWIKDNVMNIVVSVLFAIIYNASADEVSAATLVVIAGAGNYLLDLYQTWRYNRLRS